MTPQRSASLDQRQYDPLELDDATDLFFRGKRACGGMQLTLALS